MLKRKIITVLISAIIFVTLLAGCSSTVTETSQAPETTKQIVPVAIEFPEASAEYTKAKTFYGYYILQDSDVVFAMNEEETRFCVKFNAFAGHREMVLEGGVKDGACTVDPEFNGLFGEDVQMMYEDAMAEEMPWVPIKRD